MAAVELFATDSGGDGFPLLLLHGQPGSGLDLAPVARALAARARAIVPDRPGYGRTGGEAVGFRANARLLLDLLDRLAVPSAVVAGHSWGAGVALALAESAPERVDGLLLVSPVTPAGRLGRLDRVLADRRLGPPLLRTGFGLLGHSLSLRTARRLAAAWLPGAQDEEIAATGADWRARPVWRSYFSEQRALVTELPELAAALPMIDKPATVIVGGRDRMVSPQDAAALARTLPRGRFVCVSGAGHLLPQKRPDLIAAETLTLGTRSR
jgi:pimeloyl-ACP methyl ester carboxylesterase